MTAPLLSSEDRTACGHGAEAVGAGVAYTASRVHVFRDGGWLRGYFITQLATYRRLCVLAGVEPKPHWVEQIEAAIALPEAK